MDYALEKLNRVIADASTQAVLAIVSAIVAAIVIDSLPIPDFLDAAISIVTAVLQAVWDQVSSPSPAMPAGDLTMRVMRFWSRHFVEVEFRRLRAVA